MPVNLPSNSHAWGVVKGFSIGGCWVSPSGEVVWTAFSKHEDVAQCIVQKNWVQISGQDLTQSIRVYSKTSERLTSQQRRVLVEFAIDAKVKTENISFESS
jgi:hypothetical protein